MRESDLVTGARPPFGFLWPSTSKAAARGQASVSQGTGEDAARSRPWSRTLVCEPAVGGGRCPVAVYPRPHSFGFGVVTANPAFVTCNYIVYSNGVITGNFLHHFAAPINTTEFLSFSRIIRYPPSTKLSDRRSELNYSPCLTKHLHARGGIEMLVFSYLVPCARGPRRHTPRLGVADIGRSEV
ncbi:hypothetical protein EVAR_14641_1 [Eumeta japonica]|uniref:Uncharacterized protein n=1 Tax=Eumeta variegata TaxID=151549 RepID=A0A4C1U257_EUMVA|nr:hypothetical protein EVAR_14641_1 [Eumeta japonica]